MSARQQRLSNCRRLIGGGGWHGRGIANRAAEDWAEGGRARIFGHDAVRSFIILVEAGRRCRGIAGRKPSLAPLCPGRGAGKGNCSAVCKEMRKPFAATAVVVPTLPGYLLLCTRQIGLRLMPARPSLHFCRLCLSLFFFSTTTLCHYLTLPPLPLQCCLAQLLSHHQDTNNINHYRSSARTHPTHASKQAPVSASLQALGRDRWPASSCFHALHTPLPSCLVRRL